MANEPTEPTKTKRVDDNDRLRAGTLPSTDSLFEGMTSPTPASSPQPILRVVKPPKIPKAAAEKVEATRCGPEMKEVVDLAAALLPRDLEIFQRDGTLVRVVRVAANEADVRLLEGTPQIRPIPICTLVERLSVLAPWERFDGRTKKFVTCAPPSNVASTLAARGQWANVRQLTAVIETPTMRPDGTIVDVRGHDAATGYLYLPTDEFPEIPKSPTQADARRALAMLLEPLLDFPFNTEAERFVVVAAVLTIVARAAIAGAIPAFIFDASTRGSGKTLLSDLVTILATGRGAAKMNYPPDAVELEKVLGAYALRGSTVIAFDNVTCDFGGGPLDKCITAPDSVELRVLGASEVATLPWRAVILATGNNVHVIGDTVRRVLLSRLVPPQDRPEERDDFRIPDLRAWAMKERPRLVVAALTLLRAYVVAKRPPVGTKTWGSFVEWAALVPPALVWAGGVDPMSAKCNEEDDPAHGALATILEGWKRLDPGGAGKTAKEIISQLFPDERGLPPEDRTRRPGKPDEFDDLREAIEAVAPPRGGLAPEPIKLAGFFRRNRERYVGGKRLTIATGSKSNRVRWTVTCRVAQV